MMVRNESRVIERALDSVAPHVDAWFVCDTGSDDDTIARVEKRMAHLPGRIHRSRFVDFGASRTETVSRARAFCLEHGFDYLLLLDADEIVEVRDPNWKERLEGAPCLIRYDDPFTYRITALIPTAVEWRYVGRTHEYIEPVNGSPPAVSFDAIVLHDRGDGGSKADKFPRDLRLLERTLRENPDEVRAWFYLGETLRNGRIDLWRALEAYTRRAAMGSFEEEAWYAAYRRGTCLEALPEPVGGPWPAMAAWFAAWERRPWRAEPLCEIARVAANTGLSLLGALAGELAIREVLPRPERESDILFLDRSMHGVRLYDWTGICQYWSGNPRRAAELFDRALARVTAPDAPASSPAEIERLRENRAHCDGRSTSVEERPQLETVFRACQELREHRLHAANVGILEGIEEHPLFLREASAEDRARLGFERSISFYYSGRRDEAAALTLRLAARRDVPAPLRAAARGNRRFAVEPLPAGILRAGPLVMDPTSLAPGYRATNPAVTAAQGGLRIVVRTVNYRIRGDGSYDYPGFVGTRNLWGALDASDAAVGLRPIEPAFPPDDTGLVRGFEDARPVALPTPEGTRLMAVANRGRPDDPRHRRMTLLELVEEEKAVRIARIVDLDGVGDGRAQKNWMPVVVADQLLLVYSCDPTLVVRPDLDTGRCEVVRESDPPTACDDFRGGSQLVDVSALTGRPAWLAFTHGVLSEGPRRYYHTLVRFDRNLAIAAVSDPFLLRGEGLEFVAGCARDGDELVVTWGENDGEAWIGRMRVADALGLLPAGST